MPLPLPKLDNRTFDSLVAEGQLQIPRLAPQWTDYNAHDPGITLMELFAWLTEMDIFRLDQNVPAVVRSFLRRLGIEAAPALAAETILAWQTDLATAYSLPKGIQVRTSAGELFETSLPVTISPAHLVVQMTETKSKFEDSTGKPFYPLGERPQPGDAFYLGFDQAFGETGQEISLYFWTDIADQDRITRQKLIEEQKAEGADPICGLMQDPPGWKQHYWARVIWEYLTTSGNWAALPAQEDETRALSLTGAVRFDVPSDLASGQPKAGLWFIRCRLVSGGYDCPPRLEHIAINAVLARHAATISSEESIGISNGSAHQAFELSYAPALSGSFELKVVQGALQEVWLETAHLEDQGPHARVFQVSEARTHVLFGDGRSGRIPPSGTEIRARYQRGGGTLGNFPAGTIQIPEPGKPNQDLVPGWAATLPHLSVNQPYAALGGREAESLLDVQNRALQMLEHSQRAVTLTDFTDLARQVPGLPIHQARAIPNYYPELPCLSAEGCVTVVIVPLCPADRSQPSAELLQSVYHFLQRRLPVTTELHVIGPRLQEVRVFASLHLFPSANGAQVKQTAIERLERFLHPLWGGPEKTGWPVGRDIYRTEIMALLNDIPGVSYVDDVGLQGEEDTEPRCENYPLCPDELVISGKHQITTLSDSASRLIERGAKGVCNDE